MAAHPPSIRSALRKIHPFLIQAQEQNLNEADTVQRVVKVFEDVLGYDGMTEITRESLIKGKYADIAIKMDEVIRLLVEVKAAGSTLRDRHTDQARSYAAESNIRWVVLTNGIEWNLYHLTFEEGIESDLVFSVDLGKEQIEAVSDTLAILHRDSVKKDLHEDLWRRKSALSPQSIARALFTDKVIGVIRRDIRRTEGISIDEEDLVAAIKGLFSAETREHIGPIKVRRQRRKKADVVIEPSPVAPVVEETQPSRTPSPQASAPAHEDGKEPQPS